MANILNIQDDKVVISKLALQEIEGAVTHTGTLNLIGDASIRKNLTIDGVLFAETIQVKNLITDAPLQTPDNTSQWYHETEVGLNGKGLSWSWGDQTAQLVYRTGNRIWANTCFDIPADKTYNINNMPVIGVNSLGPQIIKSSLKQVGNLRSLNVVGDTTLSEFAYFNSTIGRLGLNTSEPNGILSLVTDNDVEVIIDTINDVASIGTYNNHDFSISTDNVPRVVFTKDGPIIFGTELSNADVTIHGTLKVDSLVSDNRIERASPLEFKSTKDAGAFGLGLIWTGSGSVKQFLLKPDPVRLWTSEGYDADNGYYANGYSVLTKDTLGETVVNSNLRTLGELTSLSVNGIARINETLIANVLQSTDGNDLISISPSKINANNKLSMFVNDDEIYYSDANEIVIGNKFNSKRPVKVFGPVSIGTTTPDPSVDLTVSGNVKINNKKFIIGTSAPTNGEFSKGDICWNQDPKEGGFVGWICINSGAPGKWATFGSIGKI